MANQQKPNASWTIKSFPVELRLAAVQAAAAADVSMAQWMTRAVNQALNQQANDGIIPPRTQPKIELPAIDLAGLAAATNAALAALAAAGQTPSRSLGRSLATTASYYARAARGLPPVQTSAPRPRRPNGRLIDGTPMALCEDPVSNRELHQPEKGCSMNGQRESTMEG